MDSLKLLISLKYSLKLRRLKLAIVLPQKNNNMSMIKLSLFI